MHSFRRPARWRGRGALHTISYGRIPIKRAFLRNNADSLCSWLPDDGAAAVIVAQLRTTGLENVRKDLKSPVGDAIRCIENRLALVDYEAARRAGLPVGSGAVEATCKSLLALRMKRLGARWKSRSGDDILNLRALVISDRWKPGMNKALGWLRKPVRPMARREAI